MSNKNDKHNKKKGGYIFNYLNNFMNFLNNSMNFLNNSMNFFNNFMNFILIIALIYISYYLFGGTIEIVNKGIDASYSALLVFLAFITQVQMYLQQLITAIILIITQHEPLLRIIKHQLICFKIYKV